jgi:lincosamide nucleotidyltransferase A/C/D/E
MKSNKPAMPAEEAIALYSLFRAHRIVVWVDGGWGVDALLGRQTRRHSDLDIALRHSDVPRLRELLQERGYRDVQREDTRASNFVLGDDLGQQVDVHSFELDAQGNNVFGCEYRSEHLTGEGTIGGCIVKCVPARQMIVFHTGYKIDEDDANDVKALCDTFGIEMPEEHKAYWKDRAVKPGHS